KPTSLAEARQQYNAALSANEIDKAIELSHEVQRFERQALGQNPTARRANNADWKRRRDDLEARKSKAPSDQNENAAKIAQIREQMANAHPFTRDRRFTPEERAEVTDAGLTEDQRRRYYEARQGGATHRAALRLATPTKIDVAKRR